MKRYPLYIFDMDGTLFRGADALPDAVETVAALRTAGSRVRFVTNNSTRSPGSYVEKLRGMGFEAQPSEVYTSALAAAEYLRGAVARAFVVGEDGLVAALEGAGVRVGDTEPDVVVVGLCRIFDYQMMSRALEHLLDARVRFVATNRDATFPLEGGRLVPGAGAIVASLVACSGREPELVGKPDPFLIEWILRDAAAPPSDALVIGDRVETDIVAGQQAGCDVHLVLTGVTTSPPSGVAWSPTLAGVLPRGS
jgi:4-nitrophenyl phosphatase